MHLLAYVSLILILAAISAGCAIDSGLTLAPGAEQVKITTNPADVTGCTPVGNISPDAINNLSHRLAQNQAVGLNADVVFSTGYGGVAYRCTK